MLIYGTGFRVLDMPIAERVYDAGGTSLADHWQGSPSAYLGTVVSGFQNLFLLLGPNLGTGHTSAFMILGAQLSYAAEVMPLGAFLDEPDAISRTTLDVNVWGLIHGMQLVLPGMLERNRGHVVNIASMAGKIAFLGMAVYNASKFAAIAPPGTRPELSCRHHSCGLSRVSRMTGARSMQLIWWHVRRTNPGSPTRRLAAVRASLMGTERRLQPAPGSNKGCSVSSAAS